LASKSVQEYEYFHILDLSFYEVASAIKHKVSAEFEARMLRRLSNKLKK